MRDQRNNIKQYNRGQNVKSTWHVHPPPLLSNLTRPVSDMSSIQESTVLIPLNLDPHLSLPTGSKIRRKRVNQNNSKYKQDLLNDLTNFGFNMDSVSTPPPEELAPNMDANYSSINNNQRNAEILKLKKTIVFFVIRRLFLPFFRQIILDIVWSFLCHVWWQVQVIHH